MHVSISATVHEHIYSVCVTFIWVYVTQLMEYRDQTTTLVNFHAANERSGVLRYDLPDNELYLSKLRPRRIGLLMQIQTHAHISYRYA